MVKRSRDGTNNVSALKAIYEIKAVQFVLWRIFEVPCAFILGGLVAVFTIFVPAFFLYMFIPNWAGQEDIFERWSMILSIGLLFYWWYKAFTDSKVRALGQKN